MRAILITCAAAMALMPSVLTRQAHADDVVLGSGIGSKVQVQIKKGSNPVTDSPWHRGGRRFVLGNTRLRTLPGGGTSRWGHRRPAADCSRRSRTRRRCRYRRCRSCSCQRAHCDGPGHALIAGAIAPAGGICTGKACWKATGTKGFQYANKLGTPTGLQVLKLRAGAAGKAAVSAKGKGMLVDMPPLPVTGPVLVQLSADGGACFEAEYRAAAFQKNDATQLKAKGGAPLP